MVLRKSFSTSIRVELRNAADWYDRHMAEETKNASIIVPRCMLWSYILNGAMGFVMLVT